MITTLQANGFKRISQSTATLSLNRGTRTTSKWKREIDGFVAVVTVEQINDEPETATLQPEGNPRRACAGINNLDDLQKALCFHFRTEFTLIPPQP